MRWLSTSIVQATVFSVELCPLLAKPRHRSATKSHTVCLSVTDYLTYIIQPYLAFLCFRQCNRWISGTRGPAFQRFNISFLVCGSSVSRISKHRFQLREGSQSTLSTLFRAFTLAIPTKIGFLQLFEESAWLGVDNLAITTAALGKCHT